MFRVDVYPCDRPLETQADGTTLQPAETLFACLGTSIHLASNSDSGRLLTIGRKKGDVLFPQDKSVSREHCLFRLICSQAIKDTIIETDGTTGTSEDKTDEQKARFAASPRNMEETKACQAADDGTCLVVEGIGKLGTYLVVEPALLEVETLSPSKRVDSKSSDSDETDDEDAIGSSLENASQLIGSLALPLSPVAAHLSSPKATLEMIGANETRVLENLSILLTENILSTPHRVILQCGKLGSTVVITRQPLRVLRASSGKLAKPEALSVEQQQLYGVQDVTKLDDTVTHVVTPQRYPSPKQLAAWSRGITAVTRAYVEAIMNRTSHRDAWPEVTTFAPKADQSKFWNNVASSTLWPRTVLLSVKDDDFTLLARSGGATIIPLYDLDSVSTALARANEVWNDPAVRPGCFVVTESRHRELSKTFADDWGVPRVSARQMAKALTTQQPLKDGNGRVLDGDTRSLRISLPSRLTHVTSVPSQSIFGNASATTASKSQTTKSNESAAVLTPLANNKHTKEPGFSSDIAIDAYSSGERVTSEALEKDSPEPPPKRLRSSPDVTAISDEDVALNRGDGVSSTVPKSTTTSDNESNTPEESNKANKQYRVELNKCDAIENPIPDDCKSRMSLEQISTGWFVAAPSGSKRKAYVRAKDEILEKTGYEEWIEVATTETCKGLIVPASTTTFSHYNAQDKGTGGPNFKTFRKNSIHTLKMLPQIRLRSVLPKESDHSRHQEEQLQALKHQQRKADELFRDPTRSGIQHAALEHAVSVESNVR
jgi:hypothetical protein